MKTVVLRSTFIRLAFALILSIAAPLLLLLAFVIIAEESDERTHRRLVIYHLRAESLSRKAQVELARLKSSVADISKPETTSWSFPRGRQADAFFQLELAIDSLLRLERAYGRQNREKVTDKIERSLGGVREDILSPGSVNLDEENTKVLLVGLLQIERLHRVQSSEAIANLKRGGALRWTNILMGGLLVLLVSGVLTWRIFRILNNMAEKVDERTAKLIESETRFRQLSENVDAAFWITDVDAKTALFASRGFEAIWGEPVEVLKKNPEAWLQAIVPDDRERVLEGLRRVPNGNQWQDEYRIQPAKGPIRWIRDCGFPVRDERGNVVRIAGVAADFTEEKLAREALEKALEEIKQLKDLAEAENVFLREELRVSGKEYDIVGESDALKAVLADAERVAGTDTTVLILGETGTGKELLARAIHRMSPRNEQPLIAVNCASIPANLVESELFGREKGAYTDAATSQMGRFEAADGGTIFLDEVGELPEAAQAKLLRVLEIGVFERLGSTKSIQVDLRIITATNRDLEKRVREGKFREDLFYRLNVFPISIPPLRDRPDDIPPLVRHFIRDFSAKMGKDVESVSKGKMKELQGYSWPGNVRELRNIIERGMITSRGPTFQVDLPAELTATSSRKTKLAEVEKDHTVAILEATKWRIRGEGGAAELLGLQPTTLESRMKKLGIERPH